MLDVSAQVFEAISRKLSQRPYLANNQLELRIAQDDSRVIVTLEDFGARLEGELLVSSLVLKPEKIHELYRNLRAISEGAILEIFSSTSEALQVQPKISFDIDFYDIGPKPEAIAKKMARQEGFSQIEAATMWYFEIESNDIETYADVVSEEVNETLSALEKIKELLDEFRTYDVSSTSIRELWKRVKLEKDSQKKGRILENFISVWIRSDDNFSIKNIDYRTESEEIDIVVENKAETEFFKQLQSPLMLVECKNWTSNIGSKEIRDFAQKIQNRPKFLCKVGLMITTSMYTNEAEKELLGYRGGDFLIATANGTHLAGAVSKGINFSDMCKERIYLAGLR